MSRVAHKRSLARQRLLNAGTELIAERGVDGLRLRELTERADIGFGSFYQHFASKEELVEAIVADVLGALAAAIIASAAAHEDPAATIAEAHRSFIRLADEDPRLARLVVHLDRADALLETATVPILTPLLQRGITIGRFRDVDVAVAVSFIVGATIAVMRGILDGRLGNGDEAAAASALTLLRAIGVPDTDARRLSGTDAPHESRQTGP